MGLVGIAPSFGPIASITDARVYIQPGGHLQKKGAAFLLNSPAAVPAQDHFRLLRFNPAISI